MDNLVATAPRLGTGEGFDSARITAAVKALAEQYAGREDVFRSALARLLKAELVAARSMAQATLLKDRHGRRCAETLCFVQDEISIARRFPRVPNAWRSSPPVAMAVA
jgi:[protein-PII] uridylyltransferase